MNTSNITNYKPKDFAELLGVSVKTLQRWDREGTLKANRTPTDRRYYTYDQYLQFKGINLESDTRKTVIYARVSTRNQKDDLQNQISFLRQFCNGKGIIVDQCIEDYGSGLNYNRKQWNALLDEVMEQKIKTIIVTHKDRFIRFGYDWFEKFCMKFNTTIVVVNNEELSPQEELCFSEWGFHLLSAFEVNPVLIGTELSGVPIRSMDELESFLAENAVDVAVLSVPKEAALRVTERLTKNGIRAIWNFTNVELTDPNSNILVENIHFSDSLLSLSYYVSERKDEEAARAARAEKLAVAER